MWWDKKKYSILGYSTYLFEPKEDITAYEIAYLLKHVRLGWNQFTEIDIDYDKLKQFEESVIYRHFKKKE